MLPAMIAAPIQVQRSGSSPKAITPIKAAQTSRVKRTGARSVASASLKACAWAMFVALDTTPMAMNQSKSLSDGQTQWNAAGISAMPIRNRYI